MAAFTLSSAPVARDFGRSGYNKDDQTPPPKVNKGRSGYNKSDSEDGGDQQPAPKDGGRSGYN